MMKTIDKEIEVDTLYKVGGSDGSRRTNMYPTIQTDGAGVSDVHLSINPDSVDDTDMPNKILDFGAAGADLQSLGALGAFLYVKKTGESTPKIWVNFDVKVA